MRISRIVADPSGFDRALDAQGQRWGSFINLVEELVELENDTGAPQDLGNWVLRDASRHQFVFPAGTVVPPGGLLRVRSGEGTNTSTDLFWGRRAPVWNNLGDTAFLYDDRNTLIAQRSFPDLPPEETPSYLLPQFAAETYPAERAIALLWEIPLSITSPTFPDLDALPLLILRRERRFPGLNRKGVIPVPKQLLEDGREDGTLVYQTSSFEFDFEEQREEQVGDRTILTRYQYRYQGEPRERILVRSIQQESLLSSTSRNSVPQRMTVRIIDREGLKPGNIYYYTAFIGSEYIFSRKTQASALATANYGHSLFDGLPLVHKQFDTATPLPEKVALADQSKGQLQRFLEVYNAHANMLHGFTDGLRDLHNPRQVDSRLLPQLAHLLGWQFKSLQDEDRQRNELRFAPEIYQTIGTVGNIAAIINLLTGWKTKEKEFARNVLTSVDITRFEQLEGGVVYNDGRSPTTGDRVYLDGSLKPTNPYLDYLRNGGSRPDQRWQGRRVPPGSLDTRNAAALAKLRAKAFDDQTVYSYHVPPANERRDELPDPAVLYNQQTIGLYITVDVETETFTPDRAIAQIYRIVREFLPIQVRPILYIRIVYEEEVYSDNFPPREELSFERLAESEFYGGGQDAASDRIPGWRWFISNNLRHRTVDTTTDPIDTSSRTRHTGLDRNIDNEIE